jgi:hypothetical protein
MTEDDTFRILARPDIHEMVRLHAEYTKQWHANNSGTYPTTENIRFAKHYGWNWVEFLDVKRVVSADATQARVNEMLQSGVPLDSYDSIRYNAL